MYFHHDQACCLQGLMRTRVRQNLCETHSVDVSSAALFVSPDLLPLVQTAPYCGHNLNPGLGQRPTVLSSAQQTAQLEATNPHCSLLNNPPELHRSKNKVSEWEVQDQRSFWSLCVTPALSLATMPKNVTYSNTFQSSLTLVKDKKVGCPLLSPGLDRNDEFLESSIKKTLKVPSLFLWEY